MLFCRINKCERKVLAVQLIKPYHAEDDVIAGNTDSDSDSDDVDSDDDARHKNNDTSVNEETGDEQLLASASASKHQCCISD